MSAKKVLIEVVVVPSNENASPAVSQIVIDIKNEEAMNEFTNSFVSQEKVFNVAIYRSFKII